MRRHRWYSCSWITGLYLLVLHAVLGLLPQTLKANESELYRNWMFSPEGADSSSPETIQLPFTWVSQESHRDLKQGTFRKLISDPDLLGRELGLQVNRSYQHNVITYRVYLNGERLYSHGSFTDAPPIETMAYPPPIIRVPPQKAPFELKIEVFKNRGTPWPGVHNLVLEDYSRILLKQARDGYLASLLLGVFLMIVAYHGLLWLLQREDRESLIVALMALTTLVFTANHHTSLVSHWYQATVRQFWLVQGAAWFSFFIVFDLFSYVVFPDRFPKRKAPVTAAVSAIVWIGCWFDLNALFIFQIYSWFSLGQLGHFCWKLRKDGNRRSKLYMLGLGCIVIGSVGELLVGLGILMLPSVIPYFLMAVVLIEVYFISYRNNENRLRLAYEQERVQALNNNLEAMVEEQTREIKSILEHISLGVLLVKAPGLTVTGTHSVSALKILGRRKIEGLDLMETVFQHALVSEEAKSQIQSALEASLNEDAIAFDMNAHLLPREAMLNLSQKKSILEMDWNAIQDREGRIEKLLLTFKDVTQVKQLEYEARQNEVETLLISEILKVPNRDFSIFMNAAQNFMAENIRLLKSNRRADPEVLKLLFINLHTIKGAARSLQLKYMTPKLHDLEQQIAQVQNGKQPWDWLGIWNGTMEIQSLLDRYLELNQVKLGRESNVAKSLSYEEVKSLYQIFQQIDQEGPLYLKQQVKPFLALTRGICFAPAENVISEVLSNAEMLAKDLQKEKPTIEVEAHGIHLSLDGQDLIRKTFIHLVRNTMDHGIEAPSERVQQGKPASGRISVDVKAEGSALHIIYRDDGRGLDLQSIKSRAIERGILKPDEKVDPNDIGGLIFESGLSTAQQINDISGRGVGMSAVKQYFEEAHGRVELKLLPQLASRDSHFVPFELHLKFGESVHFLKQAA